MTSVLERRTAETRPASALAPEPAPLVPVEIDGSVASLHILARLLEGPCAILAAHDSLVKLPQSVVDVLRDAVLAAAAGPADEELSTQEAARLLGVSRPTLIRLLDTEGIPHRVTGGQHRRISRRALVEYRQRDLARQRALLDELAASDEEFGFFS